MKAMLFNLPYVSLGDLRGMKVSNPQRQHLEIGVSPSVTSELVTYIWLHKRFRNLFLRSFVLHLDLIVVQWE